MKEKLNNTTTTCFPSSTNPLKNLNKHYKQFIFKKKVASLFFFFFSFCCFRCFIGWTKSHFLYLGWWHYRCAWTQQINWITCMCVLVGRGRGENNPTSGSQLVGLVRFLLLPPLFFFISFFLMFISQVLTIKRKNVCLFFISIIRFNRLNVGKSWKIKVN